MDPASACGACNGFGIVITAPNFSLRALKAMLDAELGYTPFETAKKPCKECGGTGIDWRKAAALKAHGKWP